MITLLQINKAINDRIKSALVGTDFSSAPIMAEDVSEPIIRPGLKVGIESSTNRKFNFKCREKNLTCSIYFFAKDRYKYKIDNAKMQEIIETAFLEDLEVEEGFYMPIETVESETADTVLVCSFDLYAVELLPDTDTSEPMEQLNYKEVEE
ncbi:MAG: hypothetical protein PHW03_05880 [Eubacteriales bacterium]|nr:hypothetical protein [Eubacteriales bacterium]MDD4390316.1 hypothetical protein [Eubacteriales bacterium]